MPLLATVLCSLQAATHCHWLCSAHSLAGRVCPWIWSFLKFRVISRSSIYHLHALSLCCPSRICHHHGILSPSNMLCSCPYLPFIDGFWPNLQSDLMELFCSLFMLYCPSRWISLLLVAASLSNFSRSGTRSRSAFLLSVHWPRQYGLSVRSPSLHYPVYSVIEA